MASAYGRSICKKAVPCHFRFSLTNQLAYAENFEVTAGGNKLCQILNSLRRNATKAAANKARKSNLKTMIKKADLACTENAADKEAAIRVAIKKVDQACAKGLLHKNAAARKKSQLAKKLNAAD